MRKNGRDAYLEDRVLAEDPLELVGMLYNACIAEIREARRHLSNGEIAARARSISRAMEMVGELARSLDHGRGGEISMRLAQLYDYIGSRLIDANLHQTAAPLVEAIALLSTLAEGWNGVRAQLRPAPPANPAWVQPAETAHAWSF
jgi:flagellar protein FliS